MDLGFGCKGAFKFLLLALSVKGGYEVTMMIFYFSFQKEAFVIYAIRRVFRRSSQCGYIEHYVRRLEKDINIILSAPAKYEE